MWWASNLYANANAVLCPQTSVFNMLYDTILFYAAAASGDPAIHCFLRAYSSFNAATAAAALLLMRTDGVTRAYLVENVDACKSTCFVKPTVVCHETCT